MEDVEVYVDESGTYLESLIKSLSLLYKINSGKSAQQISSLNEVIDLEIELAMMAAEKARSEIIKAKKDKVVPIK